MLPADVVTLVSDFVGTLTTILFGVIPEVLTAVAILMGIALGVRYVKKWIFSSAR
jgi:hypothetical protein